MLFQFNAHSALLLPFVVTGGAAALWLLGRAVLRGAPADALLALLVALPTGGIAQWMLGYAGWYSAPDWHRTLLFYLPWKLPLLLGPAYYLYFRALTNQEFRLGWRVGRHLLPGLAQLGAGVAVAVVDFGLRPGWRLAGPPGGAGPAAAWFDDHTGWLGYVGYALLLGYGLRMLRDYRRYRQYLHDNFSDTERLRFQGLRQLLGLHVLGLGLSLIFTLADAWQNSLAWDYDAAWGYDTAWQFSSLRGVLIYALLVVGVQANYAAASSPLRFDAEAVDDSDGLTLPAETGALPPASAATLVAADSEKRLAAAPAAPPVALLAELPATPPAGLPTDLLPWREKLLALMADEQPWLEPELTLNELAQRLHLHPAVLSKVINTGCGQHFSDFVNTYRVAEARRKLANPRFAHYSLIGIALESGFNSKSTFNRVFKKLEGQVPGEIPRPNS